MKPTEGENMVYVLITFLHINMKHKMGIPHIIKDAMKLILYF